MYGSDRSNHIESVDSALILTNCTKTTLNQAENVTLTVNIDKWTRETMMTYNMTECYKPSLNMSALLPAFITIDIDDQHYYSTMSTVYEQLPAILNSTQLNLCLRNGTQQ